MYIYVQSHTHIPIIFNDFMYCFLSKFNFRQLLQVGCSLGRPEWQQLGGNREGRSEGWGPCPRQGWNDWISDVPSSPNHPEIL